MADGDGGNSGLAFILGGLLVVVAVIAVVVFAGGGNLFNGGGGASKSVDINISAPKAPTGP